MSDLPVDRIGYWSEVKLEIIKRYAQEYSRIFHGKKAKGLSHIYVDAFAGAGVHQSKRTSDFVLGSPLNALHIDPPFREFHLIDLNASKAQFLREVAAERKDVHIYNEDCNVVLLRDIFPKLTYSSYRRALCILDPYDINPSWEVMKTAGKLGTVEIFLNFMIMDMNMNVLWRNPEKVSPQQIARMNAFWGDESWRSAAYRKARTLFGDVDEKTTNEAVADAFRQRLKDEAGFKFVPEPIPMRNSAGATVYYLYFASPNATGKKIVDHVFNMFRDFDPKGQ